MNKFIYSFIFLAVLMSFSSCERELDFKYHEIEPLTVIEAELTPEGICVALTLTTPMGEPIDRTLLTDAKISLKDLSTDEGYELTTDKRGYYRNDIGGIVGHDYELIVERNGNIWTSTTTLYPPVEIVSTEFSWIKMPYDYVSVLSVLFLDDSLSKGECYWIKIYRNGEIYKWAEMDDKSSVNGMIRYVSMMSRQDLDEEEEDEILRDGDEVTVKIYGISPVMREYVEAIGNDSNGPALFTGSNVLGYFLAATPVSSAIIYRPDEFPYWK